MTHYLLSPSFKSHLENAYYIAGFFLAFAAIFGILQYSHSRRLAKISAKREAYKLAADKCEKFGSYIIPLYHAIQEEMETKKIQFLEHAQVKEDSEHIAINLSNVTDEDFKAANAMENRPVELLNRLEAFALFFISRVAAELPAFLAVGCVYCDIVRKMFPIMASVSDDEPSYEHVKALYVLWQMRRDRMQLLKQRNKIDIELKKSKSSIISPIGA